MVRVLQIIDHLQKDSGVSSIVFNLYQNIDPEKVQMDFLVGKRYKQENNEYYDDVISRGGRVFCVGNPLSIKSLIPAVRNIKQFFKEHAGEYQVVHLHTPTTSYFTLRYAKKYGIKNRIIHSHSSMTSTNRIKAFINQFLMQGKRYANRFWTCSPVAAEFLFGDRASEAELIRNAVDSNRLEFRADLRKSMREELQLEGKKVAIHVSNFSPIKNLFFLLPIMQEAVKRNPELFFLFVGDGPERTALEQKLRDSGLEQYVRFVGRKQDLQPYFCAADFMILPSLKEGLPLVALESQACGLPCLISDTVTSVCNVGTVDFLPLEGQCWLERMVSLIPFSEEERKVHSLKFKDCDFEIVKEAKRVEQLYLELGKIDETRGEKN